MEKIPLFRIFEQLALAMKNRACSEFTVLHIPFLSFRIFEQLVVALKSRVCHELIHCIEYIFSSIRSFEQLALDLKFFTVLKYFVSFRIFEQLSLALKTEFALKFFKPWGAAALPASYVNACYCLKIMGLAFKS